MNTDRLIALATSKTAVGIYSGLLGLAAGGGAGWYFTKKYMDEKFEEELSVEIGQTQKFYENYYSRLHKGPGYSTPQEAAETLGVEIEVGEDVTASQSPLLAGAVDALVNYSGISANQTEGDGKVTQKPFQHIKPRIRIDEELGIEHPPVTVVVENNIFKDGVPISDEDGEEPLTDDELFEADIAVARESESSPYVISFEEYMMAEPGYQQVGITYFAEDDILLDDKEQIVDNPDALVGDESLRRFGYKSKNNDIVYVRNPIVELDFEITRSRRSYAADVGLHHSMDRSHIRKFRLGDDE